MDPDPIPAEPAPSLLQWTLGFLIVGMAWGLTTPFMRKAALTFHRPDRPWIDQPKNGWLKKKILKAFFTVLDILKAPGYSIPLLVNLTGSVWFFLLVGRAELSLTVPITNSLAFIFTVLGEWWVDGKVISRDTWIGMVLVLSGIALCVQSKNTTR